MEPVIEVSNLVKKYGNLNAVDRISFTVFKGDVFGFLGPNGAGKSTTIRMLTSLIKPSGGTIKIFGKELHSHKNYILSGIGAIVESPDLYNYLSAYNNLKLLSGYSGKPANHNKIMETLELVGLKDRASSKVKTFSHGMKQRLGIAQALIHNPDLIILDEPANGLDPQGIVEIRNLIRKLSVDFGKTIVLSSHILSEVELVANRMLIINKGKVVVEGEVKKLLNKDEVKLTISAGQPERAKELIMKSDYHSNLLNINSGDLIFEIRSFDVPGLVKYLVDNGISVEAVKPVRSLEDYFLNLT